MKITTFKELVECITLVVEDSNLIGSVVNALTFDDFDPEWIDDTTIIMEQYEELRFLKEFIKEESCTFRSPKFTTYYSFTDGDTKFHFAVNGWGTSTLYYYGASIYQVYPVEKLVIQYVTEEPTK